MTKPSFSKLTSDKYKIKPVTMKTIFLPFLGSILMSLTTGQVPVRAPALATLDSRDCQCEGTTYLAEDATVQ